METVTQCSTCWIKFLKSQPRHELTLNSYWTVTEQLLLLDLTETLFCCCSDVSQTMPLEAMQAIRRIKDGLAVKHCQTWWKNVEKDERLVLNSFELIWRLCAGYPPQRETKGKERAKEDGLVELFSCWAARRIFRDCQPLKVDFRIVLHATCQNMIHIDTYWYFWYISIYIMMQPHMTCNCIGARMATGSLMKRSNGLPLSRKNGTRERWWMIRPAQRALLLFRLFPRYSMRRKYCSNSQLVKWCEMMWNCLESSSGIQCHSGIQCRIVSYVYLVKVGDWVLRSENARWECRKEWLIHKGNILFRDIHRTCVVAILTISFCGGSRV